MPETLAEYVADASDRSNQSQSQIAVELATRGMLMAAYSNEDISRWQEDEIALLEAAHIAMKILHGPAAERESHIKALTSLVISAGLRKPPVPQSISSDTVSERAAKTLREVADQKNANAQSSTNRAGRSK